LLAFANRFSGGARKFTDDATLLVQSKAFFGVDYGAFRFGYSKTPVAFEGVTGTKADSFLELALPSQAIYEGRRAGIDWAATLAARVAWTPRKAEGDVIHLGVSASREDS
jgi:phosphate-selective porin OprO/OprP